MSFVSFKKWARRLFTIDVVTTSDLRKEANPDSVASEKPSDENDIFVRNSQTKGNTRKLSSSNRAGHDEGGSELEGNVIGAFIGFIVLISFLSVKALNPLTVAVPGDEVKVMPFTINGTVTDVPPTAFLLTNATGPAGVSCTIDPKTALKNGGLFIVEAARKDGVAVTFYESNYQPKTGECASGSRLLIDDTTYQAIDKAAYAAANPPAQDIR
jgi:hypothetical protein